MKRFKEWLKEALSILSRPSPIVTNPSPLRLKAMINNTEHKELRYVHNPNTGMTHVGDATHYLHHNIGAQKESEHGFVHFPANKGRNVDFDHYVTKSGHHAGYIYAHDLEHISTHGLKHFIAHKQEPNLKQMGVA